jgi:hypothetical protein
MSTKLARQSPAQSVNIAGPVAEQLLSHLGDEKESLAAMLTAVRDVHVALRDLNDEALRKSLEAEARELSSSLTIQQRRRELQLNLAPILQIPPQEVTLRRLISATSGSVRESVELIWRSLTEMATEMDRLNRQNAAMIGLSMTIARGVIERLTGVTAVGESYNAIGGRAETHVGPLIQWGG